MSASQCHNAMSRDEKRAALNRFRLLISEDTKSALKQKHGNNAGWRFLEDELMKIARRRLNEQTKDIQDRLLRGDDVSVGELVPDSKEMASAVPDAPAPVVDHPVAEGQDHEAAAGAVGEGAHESDAANDEAAAGAVGEGAHESDAANDEQALDWLIQDCTRPPAKKDRERGVKAFIAQKRGELLRSVREEEERSESKLEARGRDDAVRELGRSEFDKLSAHEQWVFALEKLRKSAGKGCQGRFVPQEDPEVVADAADPSVPDNVSEDAAGIASEPELVEKDRPPSSGEPRGSKFYKILRD